MALSKKVIRMTGEAIAGISVASASGMYVACTSSSGNFTAGSVYYCNGTTWVGVTGGGSGASVGEITHGTSTYAEVVAAFENNPVVVVEFMDLKMVALNCSLTESKVSMLVSADNGHVILTVTSANVWTNEQIVLTPEAPDDGKTYGRKNFAWVEITGDGSIEFDHETFPDESDESSINLISGYDDEKIGAERAKCDAEGNNIKETYATKAEVQTAIGDIETLLAAL